MHLRYNFGLYDTPHLFGLFLLRLRRAYSMRFTTGHKLLLILFVCFLHSSLIADKKPISKKSADSVYIQKAYQQLLRTEKRAKRQFSNKQRQINHKRNHFAVLTAKRQLNKRYRWGGATPQRGFDCSGLIQYAFNSVKVKLPRTAAAQYKKTKRINYSDLKVGDLLFFHTRRTRARVNHVGIYLGGGKFIHSPRRGKRVEIANFKGYWRKKAVGAGRV